MAGSRRSWSLLGSTCLVLACITLCTEMARAQTGLPERITYYNDGEALYTDNAAAKTFDSSMSMCSANGLNLFSSETLARAKRVWSMIKKHDPNPTGYSTYTSLSQKTGTGETLCNYNNNPFYPPSSKNPNMFYCVFTIQWGLFSKRVMAYPYGDQPGLNIYQCGFKYYTNPQKVPCGGFMPYAAGLKWDDAFDQPNGQNYTLITTKAAADDTVLANIGPVAPQDYYLPVSKFVTACEAQVYQYPPPQTFTPTQPSFILGYKDLTWVQKHWWVLFLIIAVVILIVLFAILIFCCITSAPPKEGPPIAPMVLRERNGQAYVNASDDDSTPKSRGLSIGEVNRAGSNGSNYGMNQRQGSGMMMPMMPLPVVDPEDLIQATPSIYSQDDVMQTAQGDSRASSDEDSDHSGEESN